MAALGASYAVSMDPYTRPRAYVAAQLMSTYNLAKASQLAQLTVAAGAVTTILAAAQTDLEVTTIFLCNPDSGKAIVIDLYHDDDNDGTLSYTSGNLLYTALTIPASGTERIEGPYPGTGISVRRGGSLALEVTSTGSVVVSIYGVNADVTGA